MQRRGLPAARQVRRLLAIAVLATLALVGAACGSSGGGGTAPTTTSVGGY